MRVLKSPLLFQYYGRMTWMIVVERLILKMFALVIGSQYPISMPDHKN